MPKAKDMQYVVTKVCFADGTPVPPGTMLKMPDWLEQTIVKHAEDAMRRASHAPAVPEPLGSKADGG